MMTHRSFLLALLAATFVCIIILQMSLDGWILGGTVHYTFGVERKDQDVKIAFSRHSDAEPRCQNLSMPSDVLESGSPAPTSVQSSLPESTSTTSDILLQQEPLLEASENFSSLQPQSLNYSDSLNLQKTVSSSNNSLPLQPISSSFVNSSFQQEVTISSSNLGRQDSESAAAPNFSLQFDALSNISKSFLPPQQMSSVSNNSQLLESRSRKLSSVLHSIRSSEIRSETSTVKSLAEIPRPPVTNLKPQSQRELQTNASIQARIKVHSFEPGMRSRDILQRNQPQELISAQERLQEIMKQRGSFQVRSRPDPLRSVRPIPTVNPSDVTHVILLTYFRSGSTFVGDLLQQNWKTFYHFEPLHFMTYDSRIGERKLEEAFDLFGSILRCNFSNQENYLRWAKKPDNQFLFERNVFLWFSCKTSPRACFTPEMVSAVCQRAPVQIMKVTRLHMRHLREFLLQNPDIKTKVVYLVRDPRGVISSRRTLDWCSDTQCSDPHILCSEMEDDLTVFNELQDREPEKFIQVLYEDIALNPEREARRLFEFLGLPFSRSVQRFLKTHTTARKADNLNPYSTRRNSSSMAFSWQHRLTFAQVRSIQAPCSEVIQELNYTLITSPRQLYGHKRTKSSPYSNSPYRRGVNFKTSDNLDRPSGNYRYQSPENKAVNSAFNMQAVEKNITFSNYAENNASANAKGHLTAVSSTNALKKAKNYLDSSSAVDHLQPQIASSDTYDHNTKNR